MFKALRRTDSVRRVARLLLFYLNSFVLEYPGKSSNRSHKITLCTAIKPFVLPLIDGPQARWRANNRYLLNPSVK
uniref:Uncharacterized protein n=1 Tax=Phlebia radiata TaxID=5308 RepID=L8B9D3_PHLRA|nr:hypothetical protein PRA_mt0134 [Phlebia radiata]CCE89220.1 hypothetical protein PRA_mt0134 [Phlebia radiata]